jgi:DNA/RNA-binding domain of Phe-tRNA-synthetase-like protein
MEFTTSKAWQEHYPGAAIGILALDNASNPRNHPALEVQKQALEKDLRRQYGEIDRATLRSLPVLQAYHNYYKRFKKSYHVQLQLESVASKGKSRPQVAALVEAMFMAELKNQLLTAGHDLAKVVSPFGVDVADGDEDYERINGQEQRLKKGDMFIADAKGVMSSIIYGPDRRTQISTGTTAAVFTVYAPEGIDRASVESHLGDIRAYISLFSPELVVLDQRVYPAKAGA